MNKTVEVTAETFTKMINERSLVVVDCWAAWCTPCHMIAPVIEELAQDYSGRVLFGKLNVDDNQAIATRYEIMTIPTLLIFKNGRLVDRIIGAMPRQTLEPKITRFL